MIRPFARHLRMLGFLAVVLLLMLPADMHAQASPPVPEAQARASAHPPRTAYSLPPEKLAQAIRLSRESTLIYFCDSAWMIVFLWILLQTRVLARIRDWAREQRTVRLQGFIVVATFLMLLSVAQLPASLLGHHLSRVYGLSIESWGSWFGDWCKSTLLFLFIGCSIGLSLMAVIRRSPRRWWFWFWLLSIPFVVLATYLVPTIIDPLFNHFKPLAATNPKLVDQLERVVSRGHIDIPPSRMFLMKASEKYTSVNAYVTGFGSSKRVVVWDTTIQKATPDEILFIYGHEQGHYVLNHVAKGLVGGFAASFVFLWIGFHITRWLIRCKGQRWHIAGPSDWASLGVLMLVFSILNFIAQPVANAISRTIEHHADVYGQEVIHGLVTDPRQTAIDAFQVVGEGSLDDPNPNGFVEFWAYSHPSTTHRIEFAAHYDPWAPGQHPRYFLEDQ